MKTKISKKRALLNWCLNQGIFNSADVYLWGKDFCYMSAGRRVREFVEDFDIPLRRIPDFEAKNRKLVRPGLANLAWYEVKRIKPKFKNQLSLF